MNAKRRAWSSCLKSGIGLIAALVIAAGCSSSTGNTDSNPDGDRYGGTVIQPIVADPTTLNAAITTGTPELYTACKIFEGLVRLEDESMAPMPGLAESWEIADDGLSYTFHLQENVTWHDSEPFTSEDVRWSLSEVSAKYGPRTTTAFKLVTSITAPDDHTVIIELKSPFAPFMKLLTCANAAILPKHIYGEGDVLTHPRNTNNPVGTGPFKFEEWVHDDHITLVRNENYWREDRPYLDRVIMRVLPDAQARKAALLSGNIDLIGDYALDSSTFVQLKDEPELRVFEDTNVPTDVLLFFNTKRAPLDDPKVRQALARGIDREQIAERAYFGVADPAVSSFNSGLTFNNPDVNYLEMYPYEPDRARSELAAAGVPVTGNNVDLSLTLSFNVGDPESSSAAQLMKEQLGQAGVDISLEPLQSAALIEKIFDKHDFDLFLIGYTTNGDAALGVSRAYICSAVGHAPYTNAGSYCNPEVDELFAQGAAGVTPEARQAAYYDVQELLAEELPVLTIVEQGNVSLANKRVHGVWTGPDIYDYWDEVWISD